jgi:hypothetical protein
MVCGDSLLNVVMSPMDMRNSKEMMDQMGKAKEIEKADVMV